MKKFKNLGRILRKDEQKKIGGGPVGCPTYTCTGTNSGGPNGNTCDYHFVNPATGYESDLCEQGCFSDCNTTGCTHSEC